MLTRQVKVKLDREVDDVVTRLSRRDQGAKSALIRKVVLAEARRWKENRTTHQLDDSLLSGPATGVTVKVWFSDTDLDLISRMAESECLSVPQCVRRTVAEYVKKLTT